MFQNLNFWQKWSASSRTLYQIGLFLLTISLMLLGFAYFKGLENVVQWNILSELADASFKLDEFNANGLPFAIPAKAYYVTEQFIASPLHINLWASEAYVLLCAIGFGLIASASTALPRISYLVVMIILIFAIMTMQWDLFLNHSGNLTAGILITLFGILSYYFHAFGTEIAILKRFFSFTALISTFVVVVWLLSKQPFDVLLMHLAAYRLPMALLLSVGFIFWVSFEILNGFLYVSTNAGSSQSLLNFSVMSFFYLGNVLLVWLKNASIIDWDIVYLSPFLLLAVSTILGLWGFRKRRHLVAQEMPFQISGAYIYVGLAIITLATAFFSFATANDPLQEFLEDAITYSHLVMGFFFYCYVFTNFFALFVQKLDVSKVVFKPLRLPLYVFRIIAVIVIATLLALKGYFTINQGFAGYYATLGDLSTFKKEYQFAEIQYKQALQYEFRNHKTNYALASLALIQGDNATAGVYFRQAVQKVPSPFAYSGLSRSLMQENQFFQSMFILKEGLEKFPKSGELQHNLAYLFEKSNLPDSAQFYYQKAVKNA